MAFYEMLPGAGMPPGLQAGMDSVLNKKFGTSTTYPAEDWPDTVNLMGPLPEKTVSGAIVTFSDGADAVPLKKCEITLPASLDGYSSVDVVSAGKNLFDNSEFPKTISDTNYYGQFQSNVGIENRWYIPEIHIIPDIQYTLSFDVSCNVEPFNISIGIGRGGYLRDLITATNRTSGRNSVTFTLTSALMNDYGDILTFRVPRYNSSTSFEFTISNIQLEVGATATTYEPYEAPTTHTAQLGRTIHGGSVDVVNGVGTETHGLYTFTGNEVYVQQTNQVAVRVSFTVGPSYQTGLDTAMTSVEDFVAVGCGASNYLYVKTTMTPENLKTYMANHTVLFAYVLATPTDFTFTGQEIPTRLGYNAFWSDNGDTEVTYRADINLALGGN